MADQKVPVRTGRSEIEKQLDESYGKEAVALIKGAMGLVDIDFVELEKRLEKQGHKVALSTLRKKVNGGQCKVSFMMRIMDAIGVDLAPIKKSRD